MIDFSQFKQELPDFILMPEDMYVEAYINIDMKKGLIKESAAGNKYLKLMLRIADNPNNYSAIFHNLMLTGKGADYGKSQIRRLLEIIHSAGPNNMESYNINANTTEELAQRLVELIDKQFISIKVGFEKARGEWKDKNTVKKFISPLDEEYVIYKAALQDSQPSISKTDVVSQSSGEHEVEIPDFA